MRDEKHLTDLIFDESISSPFRISGYGVCSHCFTHSITLYTVIVMFTLDLSKAVNFDSNPILLIVPMI